MLSHTQSILHQRVIRNLPALSGGVGIIIIATFLLQVKLGDDELLNSYKDALRFAGYLGANNIAVVVALNIFGVPIVANFLRREVNPHCVMLFRASRVLGCATVLLLPWFFEIWISFFGLLVIPPLVIIHASRICPILQRGIVMLGALFFSYGVFVIILLALQGFELMISGGDFVDARLFISCVAFLVYAIVAMLLGAELLRSDRDSNKGAPPNVAG